MDNLNEYDLIMLSSISPLVSIQLQLVALEICFEIGLPQEYGYGHIV